MRKVSSIVGLSVIASDEGVNLGSITEVITDLSRGAIVGLIVGASPAEKGVMAEDIAVIGPDAVMIGDGSKMQLIGGIPDLASKRRAGKDKPVSVITKSGMKLGSLAEIYIDPVTWRVVRYDVSGGSVRDLTDGTLSLPLSEGVVHGPDTVIVPDSLITSLDEQIGGLRGTWAAVSKRLRQDLHRASSQASVLYQRSSETMKDAVEQARHKSEQVSKTIAEKLEQSAKAACEEPSAGDQESENSSDTIASEPDEQPQDPPVEPDVSGQMADAEQLPDEQSPE
jgi:uncharacterized protein YrrD